MDWIIDSMFCSPEPVCGEPPDRDGYGLSGLDEERGYLRPFPVYFSCLYPAPQFGHVPVRCYLSVIGNVPVQGQPVGNEMV